MKFEKYYPSGILKDYIKYFVVSENHLESEYKVYPSMGLVLGFQFKGQLASIKNNCAFNLTRSGITGLTGHYNVYRNSAHTGTVLVYFRETGFTHFTSCHANELFNQSLSLEDIFDKAKLKETEEKLDCSVTDKQRIEAVEQFLLKQLRNIKTDILIAEGVKVLYQTQGRIRIKQLHEKLCISQSPFEKRFRKIVGTSPKKFASLIRFNMVLESLHNSQSLTEVAYQNYFYDQAHFIKSFKQYTGATPETFRQFI